MKMTRKTSQAPSWGRNFENVPGLVPGDTSHRWYKTNSPLLAASRRP